MIFLSALLALFTRTQTAAAPHLAGLPYREACCEEGEHQAYTVVLDWLTADYSTYRPFAVHVSATHPLVAVSAAVAQAVEDNRAFVAEFQNDRPAEDLIDDALEIFGHVITLEGTCPPVDFLEIYA